MNKKFTAIITAAGSGSRFSGNSKTKSLKQFINLNGKPVLLYSLLVLEKNKYVNEIIISANKKYFDYIHNLASANNITKLTKLVEGGKTRFESVRNAFRQIKLNKGFILIHDAARPNIDKEFVNNLALQAFKKGEVIPALKIPETIKRVKKGKVKETMDRENLWLVQTPQIFSSKVLLKSYKKARKKINFTDEAAMVEAAGFNVYIAEGKKENIKITTQEDLKLLKLLIK
jgi:2-C-methyl-D-erythritol 4-phosphate cytidylyltransferase